MHASPSKNTHIHDAADGETSVMLSGRAAVVCLYSVPKPSTFHMLSRLFRHSQSSSLSFLTTAQDKLP